MSIIRMPYGSRDRVSLSGFDPSMTVQSDKDSCDVNLIIRQYDRTGVLTSVNEATPQFVDVGVHDYKESIDFVMAAQEAFDSLPAAVRKRFNGSPAEYLDFVNSSDNRSEAVELGLIDPDPVPPSPIDVRVIPDPTPSE